jgi:hypothetical protein
VFSGGRVEDGTVCGYQNIRQDLDEVTNVMELQPRIAPL